MQARKENEMDIRKHRFVPNFSTASRVIPSKRTKRMSRRFLNDKRNWN